MERLTGQDASFLYTETPRQHTHTLKIALIEPSTVPGGYTVERIKDELRQRQHLLPPFRRRVVFPPLKLHHPWCQLNFGIVAVPEHLPDVRRFADLLPSALEELQKEALHGRA